MSAEPDDETTGAGAPPAAAPKKRGRPPGARTGTGTRGRPPTARIERRSKKTSEALRELLRLRMPELDVSDLSFGQTVDRDVDAWGDFLAQIGEWIPAFGSFLDLVVGAALVRVLRVAPSIRAGRRDLAAASAARREARSARDAENAAELGEHELAPEPVAGGGMFAEMPVVSREEWLSGVHPNKAGGAGDFGGFAHGHGGGVYPEAGGAGE